ncbi:hypothetical protein M409DRAFT_70964 [Zasmidium cellare ATCC 36951]|uniref:Translin n=1 Tax=Zasmidium cellare ATCC 36951 TaxID=1080233 RepID=A0A6A6BXT6_ZASCE|nr:uncharacterized protein M409DRAFT_70964 [Zasmidium cellare ATCC 36951]KAF2159515.1 hypothetical protein M409DRAFT_70964 [Zasmidium cellare ATCC 36951]
MAPKRSHAEMSGKKTDSTATSSSPLMPMFEHFRAELDEHHDRRERIIKASRDVTAASKKIIFTLQRTRTLSQPVPAHVTKSNTPYHEIIKTQLSSVAADLQGLNAHRYARQISGGCQEFMEAALFSHYLTTSTLLSYEAAAEQLQALGVGLSVEDYVLGVFDFTGEVMRFAITAMATSGALPAVESGSSEGEMEVESERRTVLDDLRVLRTVLEGMNAGGGPFGKECEKKMDVMRASVEKVERALYGLVVRGAERPKGWMPDTDAARPVEVEG